MSKQEQRTLTLNVWDKAPYVFLNGELPERARERIDEKLSYEPPDAQWTDAWRNNEWDGKKRLLRVTDDGSLYFPLGCLSMVTHILEVQGVEYTVEGLERPGRGDMDFAWETDMTLRDYQSEAVTDALRAGSGVIVMPTGVGKGVVGIRLAYELRQPTLVLVHRKEIADQWVEEMESILDHPVSRYYGGDREEGPLMVGLYQSLYDDQTDTIRQDVDLDHDVLICDETHRVAAQTWRRVAMGVTAPYRFGLTATMSREDNSEIEIVGGTGDVIADLTDHDSVAKLIEDGHLAEPQWEIYETTPQGGAYKNWQSEYAAEIVQNEDRNDEIAAVTETLDRPTLITVERLSHGERLESKIPDAEFTHGSDSERDAKIQGFRDGDIDVLIATRGIVGEGFDVPEIRSFVVAGGLKSSTSMIQQVGRALRPGEEGTATLIDFIDKGSYVGDHSSERIRTYKDYYGEEYGP